MEKSDTRYERSDVRYENSDIRYPLTSSRSDCLCIRYIWYSLHQDTDEVSGIWKSWLLCKLAFCTLKNPLKVFVLCKIGFHTKQKPLKDFVLCENLIRTKQKPLKDFWVCKKLICTKAKFWDFFVWKPISHKRKTFKGFLRVQKANSHKTQVLGFF